MQLISLIFLGLVVYGVIAFIVFIERGSAGFNSVREETGRQPSRSGTVHTSSIACEHGWRNSTDFRFIDLDVSICHGGVDRRRLDASHSVHLIL